MIHFLRREGREKGETRYRLIFRNFCLVFFLCCFCLYIHGLNNSIKEKDNFVNFCEKNRNLGRKKKCEEKIYTLFCFVLFCYLTVSHCISFYLNLI